MEDCDTVRS